MKYRKKPVEIEAEQFVKEAKHPLSGVCYQQHSDVYLQPHIHTLEGEMHIAESDWIIKGVKGEFYPCKPDIFEMTYEKV